MNTATYSDLHVRLDANIKKQAESVLDDLGIAPSSAINMFYRQIISHDGIPFKVIRTASPIKNIDKMTTDQINADLDIAESEIATGNYTSLDKAFQEILKGDYAKI